MAVLILYRGGHDDKDVKGRWCLGMGERKEKKRKRGGCGSDQGIYETRVVCVWNGGTDQIGMGMQGKGRDETNCKRKEKKKKRIVLVYVTDLPVRMQGFWVLVIANVYGHVQITGQRRWV